MRVLLVEPAYYSRYPPLGLLKLASYHRSRGNEVKLVRGINQAPDYDPDLIEITSLFTYAWKPVHEAIDHYHERIPDAQIRVGGIYASILPERIKELFPFVKIQVGLFEPSETYLPAYDILKTTEKWDAWDGSILFSSRGCIRKCPFCVVPKLEGKLRSVISSVQKYIYPSHSRIILWDNNFLASPAWRKTIKDLQEIGLKVDFNQGLDARLIDEENARLIADLKLSYVRMAYDRLGDKRAVTKAVDLLVKYGVRKRRISFYTLFNFYDSKKGHGDTPETFFTRVKYILALGCVSYPMRYEPLNSLKKNKYISPLWTKKQIEMVMKARRVIGFGGSFPPYTGLIEKFDRAKDFQEAFQLRTLK